MATVPIGTVAYSGPLWDRAHPCPQFPREMHPDRAHPRHLSLGGRALSASPVPGAAAEPGKPTAPGGRLPRKTTASKPVPTGGNGPLDGRGFAPARRARSACEVARCRPAWYPEKASHTRVSALDSSCMVKSTKALSTAKRSPVLRRAGFPFALPCAPGAVPVGR